MERRDEVIVDKLLEIIDDKDKKVREQVYKLLIQLSKLHPSDISIRIMKNEMGYKNQQISLKIMNEICNDNLECLNESVIENIIEFTLQEPTKFEDRINALQILTKISEKYCVRIVEKCLHHIQTNTTAPCPYIIEVFGNLARYNVPGFFPFIKSTLELVLPTLSTIKSTDVQITYATAIGRLAEGILEFINNNLECGITKDTYSHLMEDIYDIFINLWLQSYEFKVSEVVLEAMCHMILLFSEHRLNNEATETINSLLPLYKRSSVFPRYAITQCLSNLLSITPENALQPVIDNVLHILHDMVWLPQDFSQPLTVKNHNEVLRCYGYIGIKFSSKLCDVIMRSLRSMSEQEKVIGLIIATHLLGFSDNFMTPYTLDLKNNLRLLLNESSVKVNKHTVKLIVAMAYKDYLTDGDGLFIRFLVTNTFHQNNNNSSYNNVIDVEDLESMCQSTICLLISSVESVQPLCWNVFQNILLNLQHSSNRAINLITQSMADLVCKPHILRIIQNNDIEDKAVMVCKLLRLLANASSYVDERCHIIQIIAHYIPININNVDEFIETCRQLLQQGEMEKCLDLILDCILQSGDNNNEWLTLLIKKMILQLPGDNNGNNNENVIERNDELELMSKCVALIACQITNDELIQLVIDKLIYPIKQRNVQFTQGCSNALGIICKSHSQIVLQNLANITAKIQSKKPSRFLSLLKDSKVEVELEATRFIMFACYSNILQNAPPKQLMPNLSDIVKWLTNQFTLTKDKASHDWCIKAILNASYLLYDDDDNNVIGDQVKEIHGTLLATALTAIESANAVPPVMLLKVITSLTKTRESLPLTDRVSLLRKCYNKFFSCQSDVYEKDQECIIELCNLTEAAMEANNSNASLLDELVQLISPWLGHNKLSHRYGAIHFMLSSIRAYAFSIHKGSNIRQVGSLIARVSIRSFEHDVTIKTKAKECSILLFLLVDNNELDNTANSNSNSLDESQIKDVCDKYSVIDVFKNCCCNFALSQLPILMDGLITGLTDTQDECCFGASELLHTLLKQTANSIHNHMDLFNDLLKSITKLPDNETRENSIKCIFIIATHNVNGFVNVFLNQSIPLSSSIAQCWRMLSNEKELAGQVLDHLLHMIEFCSLYDVDKSTKHKNIISLQPLVVICALKEIFNGSNGKLLQERMDRIFVTLIMMLYSYVTMRQTGKSGGIFAAITTTKDKDSKVNASKETFEALSALLKCTEYEESYKQLNNSSWFIQLNEFKRSSLLQSISEILRSVFVKNPENIVGMITKINGYISSKIDSQRVVVAIFYSQILNVACHSMEDTILANSVITNLLSLLNDASSEVREAALISFTYIPSWNLPNKSMMDEYGQCILSALLDSLDECSTSAENIDDMLFHSLIALNNLIPLLNDQNFSNTYLAIATRIKPFFEKDNASLRRASIELFGQLASHVTQQHANLFMDQAKNNIICLLVHLGETNTQIVNACKSSIQSVASLFNSNKFLNDVTSLAQQEPFNYEKCLSCLVQLLLEQMPGIGDYLLMAVTCYEKSMLPDVRAAGALLTAAVGASGEMTMSSQYMELAITSIVSLLKDNEPSVRLAALSCLNSFYSYS